MLHSRKGADLVHFLFRDAAVLRSHGRAVHDEDLGARRAHVAVQALLEAAADRIEGDDCRDAQRDAERGEDRPRPSTQQVLEDQHDFSASRRSWMMSPASSIPTESRTPPGERWPERWTARGSAEWVMPVGFSIRVRIWPRDTASVIV